jgi:hypothetical protein
VDIHTPLQVSGPPVDLYKFSSLEGERLQWFEGMVVRGELYFAHPYELNDPFECRPRFISSSETTDPALLKAKLRTYLKNQGLSRAQIRMLPQRPPEEVARVLGEAYRLPDGEQRNVQMFCMTTTRDHPLLWAHYANGHRGACVHLDQHYIPFPAALPVHYETDYPVIPILDELPGDEVYRRVLFVKAKDWKYEGEYRVIRYMRSPTGNMDMKWTGQLAQASPSAVIGVTLGARISPENQAAVLDMVKRRSLAVPVWKAEPDEEQFGFNFTKIFG